MSIGVYKFKLDNANGLSPYSTTVSVSQSASNEFDYTITQIDNDCGKDVQYGIKGTPVGDIEWQTSNVFLNKPYTNPFFYIRNADNLIEVSDPYQIPL